MAAGFRDLLALIYHWWNAPSTAVVTVVERYDLVGTSTARISLVGTDTTRITLGGTR